MPSKRAMVLPDQKYRDLGLLGSTGHARVPNRTTQGFHLVVGPGVFAAGQRRLRTGAKLFVEVHRERFDGAQPRCRKRRERRRRRSPLAGSRAAEVGRRRRHRKASVIGPLRDDCGGGVLADQPALIGLGQPMTRQEGEVLRVNRRDLRWEPIDQDIARGRAAAATREPEASRMWTAYGWNRFSYA